MKLYNPTGTNALAGIAHLDIDADVPDAVAFDQAVARIAEQLRLLGDEDSLDVRRSKAIGILADPEAVLALLVGPTRHGLADRGYYETSHRIGVWQDSIQVSDGTLSFAAAHPFSGVALNWTATRRRP